MLSDKVELGENMGLSVEKLANTTELFSNYFAEHKESDRELKMLIELLKSGSKDEQHLLAQALLEMAGLNSDK